MPYEIKRATMPYFKPYVVVNTTTNVVVYHCDTRLDAEGIVQMIANGVLAPEKPNNINTDSPLEAFESRMALPFGQEKPDKPVSIPGNIPKRRIEI